MKAANYCVFQS